MSQYPPQPGPPQTYYYQPPPTNALGIAGFVVSLSGMIVCLGLTCPIGLVLSLIALAKAPRGYAIAGSIIGLLGSGLGVLSILVFTSMVGNLFNFAYYNQTTYLIDNASIEIDNYFSNNQDTLPDTTTGNGLLALHLDEWGYPLSYQPTAGSTKDYTITSPGPDGVLSTSDDIVQYYTAQTQTDFAMDNAYWEIDDYHTDYGRLPNDAQGTQLISYYTDSWGNDLKYKRDPGSTDSFDLISAGPDGQFDTADDITQQFSGFLPFATGQTPPGFQGTGGLDDQAIARAFDAAAKKIIEGFPPGAALPTSEQVGQNVGVMLDAWQTPMRYSPTDNPPIYHLQSAGPDRQWDTEDDLTRSFYFAPAGETDGPL